MPKTQPPQRSALSQQRVISTAIGLADQQGLKAVTMRKIALQLNVEAMSLYNHIANKEALLDAMVEAVLSEVSLPSPSGEWQQELRHWCFSMQAALSRHPWATLLLMERMNIGPAMLSLIDTSLGCLVNAGFSLAEADQARNALTSHIYGFVLSEQNFPIEPGSYAEAASEFLPNLPEASYPYMRALAVEVIEGRFSGLNDFSFGLDLILDSLARLAASTQKA